MGRQIEPKAKKYRRFGERRTGAANDASVKKPYAPGVHGKTRRPANSEYGRQLMMKQKIKMLYGVMERQFRKHYREAAKGGGKIGERLMQRLEMRLDNVVYRLGLATTREQARQIVNHGAIFVNGKKVDIPSYHVAVGDVISVNPRKQGNGYFTALAEQLKDKKDAPAWVLLNAAKWEGKVTALPQREDIGYNVDPQVVVEFYSK